MTARSSRAAVLRVLISISAAVGLALGLVAPASAAQAPSPAGQRNGGVRTEGLRAAATVPLGLNAGWQRFEFAGAGTTAAVFEVTTPIETWLRLTDAFCAGDQFDVLDGASDLGPTSAPTATSCGVSTESQTRAEVGDEWSSGGWLVPAGRHSITVKVTRSPFGVGAAFVRADSPVLTTVHMRGADERPGPGDPDATGVGTLLLRGDAGQVCYVMLLSGLDPVLAGHIHQAPAGVPGPIVVNLQLPPGPQSVVANCVPADRAVLRQIAFAPWKFYTNVHTTTHPAGAIRGQLQPPRQGPA
jgi:CHRD domain